MTRIKARLALFAAAAVAMLVIPAAAWADCIKDAAGSGTQGGLCCNYSVMLPITYINDSDWTGNLAYNANRYDGGGAQTYHVYVSSGSWNYGTSGDVYRSTEIQRGGSSNMSAWTAIQYAQTHC